MRRQQQASLAGANNGGTGRDWLGEPPAPALALPPHPGTQCCSCKPPAPEQTLTPHPSTQLLPHNSNAHTPLQEVKSATVRLLVHVTRWPSRLQRHTCSRHVETPACLLPACMSLWSIRSGNKCAAIYWHPANPHAPPVRPRPAQPQPLTAVAAAPHSPAWHEWPAAAMVAIHRVAPGMTSRSERLEVTSLLCSSAPCAGGISRRKSPLWHHRRRTLYV